jgi:F420H(2)-dependent quinone reductase
MNNQAPLPPPGERGKRITGLDRLMTRLVTGTHRAILRTTRGHVLNTMGGNHVRILTTTGRHSGQPRSHPVITIDDGPNTLIVATNGGAADHPAWLQNIAADPDVYLERNGHTIAMHATILSSEQKHQLWHNLVQAYPTYETMQRKTDRDIPVVRLTPSATG